ncbi:MAG: hypothetical protein ACJAVN_001613 [Roseivirga sp.]|jgi:hypothetical protein
MKIFYSMLFMVLATASLVGQDFDMNKFTYKELPFFAEKEQIIKILGEPNKEFLPQNECGFLSTDSQSKVFYSLRYDYALYTGASGIKYLLEELSLEDGVEVSYDGHKLTNQTDLDELIAIFGMDVMGSLHDTYTGRYLVRSSNSDDGISFILENGKVVKIRYWSPC